MTQPQRVFIKTNDRENDTLIKEASGLAALSAQIKLSGLTFIKVPEVIAVSRRHLRLENIVFRTASAAQMSLFGKELALFHQVKQQKFGWHEDNFIGLAIQRNQLCHEWGEFFIRFRLEPQIAMIRSPDLKHRYNERLESRRDILSDYLSSHCHFPSLLHGDMWAGNVLFDCDNAWLIDPSVYTGDREVDIAMTEMFGGFSPDFYSSYHQTHRLSDQYSVKKTIYNLYHYLNHFNLFGHSYLTGCEEGFTAIAAL